MARYGYESQVVPCLVVVLHIDDSALELPRRHLAVEQDIQLAVTPALEFRQAEVSTDEAYCRSATPDVATLACQIPACRIEHLTCKVNHWNFSNLIRKSLSVLGHVLRIGWENSRSMHLVLHLLRAPSISRSSSLR
jgi:hypothetical protein